MAIRINLPNSKKPPVKFEQAFSSDRAAALARLAMPKPATEVPGPVPRSSRPPGFPRPSPTATPLAPAVGTEAGDITEAPGAAGTAGPGPTGIETAAGLNPGEVGVADGAAKADASPAAGGEAAAATDYVSEGLLEPTNVAAKARAFSLIIRWGFLAGVGLVVAFMAVRFLVPFLQELQNPGKTDAIHDKNAPTAVRVLQQTREVVNKNNANVGYLNTIVAVAEGENPASQEPVKPATTPPPVARRVAPVEPGAKLTPLVFQEAVERLAVGGVFDGPEPRVYLNGRIVKYGEIVDSDLSLRFIGVDTTLKAVLFTNAENVTFRKYY